MPWITRPLPRLWPAVFFRIRLRLRLQNTAELFNPDPLTPPGTNSGGGSEDLHTSGLVLVTPLDVEIQKNTKSGRVRTTVNDTDSATGNNDYVSNVHIKVIGS